MRASLLLAAITAALAALGCSDDESCPACGTTGTGGGGSGDGGAGGGGSGSVDTSCGGPEGRVCGPHAYCDYSGDPCAPEAKGACMPRPMQCSGPVTPTCTCEGKAYSSVCEANQAGFDAVPEAMCGLPEGVFACGAGLCKPNEYCERFVPGAPPMNPDDDNASYACKLLPAACGDTPSCVCLKIVPCGDSCAPSSDGGGFVVSCYAP